MKSYSPNRRPKQAIWSATYASRSPETFIRRLLNKRRYLKREISLKYLMSLWSIQEGLCAISRVPMTHLHGKGHLDTNISIDKINPNLGYIEGNVQLVCRVVNHMKWINSTERLIWWCYKIITLGHNETRKETMEQIENTAAARPLTDEELLALMAKSGEADVLGYATEGEEPTEGTAKEPTVH